MNAPSNTALPLIEIENLRFGYSPAKELLKNLTLNIPAGSLNMLMGASGSGKTTLLKIVAGLLRPSQGRVSVFGRDISSGMPAATRLEIGYIPQQLGLVRNLTVLENVLIGSLGRCKSLAALLGIFPKREVLQAKAFLDQLKISHKADDKVIHLSGGERQRVAIARTLMQKPRLILADELVSELDLKTAGEILEMVQVISRRDGVTFLMSMHEIQLVRDLEGSVFVMKDGRLSAECRGSELDTCTFEGMLQ